MTAAQIIEEIVALPPSERAAVIRFTRTIDTTGQLSAKELSALASRLADTSDATEVPVLRDFIERGFYGQAVHA